MNSQIKKEVKIKQIENARIKHPIDIERYTGGNPIMDFKDLPYILLGIDPNEEYVKKEHSGNFSYIHDKSPDKYEPTFYIIEECRNLIEKAIKSEHLKTINDSNFINSWAEFKITDIIDWLHIHKPSVYGFTLELNKAIVKDVKKREKKYKNVEDKIKGYDLLIKENEQLKEDLCFTLEKDSKRTFGLFAEKIKKVAKINKLCQKVPELDSGLVTELWARCVGVYIIKEGGKQQITLNPSSKRKSRLSYDSIVNYLKEHFSNSGKTGRKNKEEKKKHDELLNSFEPFLKGSDFEIFRTLESKNS